MRKLAIGGVLLVLGACAEAGSLENIVEVCGRPSASPEDTVRFCQRALASEKLDPEAAAQVNVNLGIGYFELGHYGAAIDAYSAAIEDSPEIAAAWLNRARARERQGQLQEAVDDYAEALRLDPKAADAYLGRGALLLAHGDPKRAIDDFSRAVDLQQEWLAARYNRGLAHLALGNARDAAKDFTFVIERDEEDASAWMNRGRARAMLGETGAEGDFDRAIELEPEWGAAWFARGQYRDEQGERARADSDFLRADELGHADPFLIERVREISGGGA